MRSTCMPAARSGRCPLAHLLRGNATCLCAAAFLALLVAGYPQPLCAQNPQSSNTTPPQKQSQHQPQSAPQTQPPAKAGQQDHTSSGPSASPAQPQDESLGQGDQSLQPDPLANPVNPPPTPDEPAASDPDASWIAPAPAPAPASPPSGSAPGAFPGGPSSHPPADAAQGAATAAASPPAAPAPPPVPKPAKASDPLRQQINNQCADLLAMANTLQSAVAKTTKDELSVTVVRTAGQIEDLVRKLKDEMRPALSRN
jgi:hypothetical protein